MPHITLVEPDDVKPGSEVTVQASGGYVRDACGRYEESARGYKLYFDDEPVADLQCYVNHCEGKFIMPLNALPGQHCLGVQKGACQVELEVGG